MKPRVISIFILLAFIGNSCSSQAYRTKQSFTHDDTLRGTVTRERAWWDVVYYDVHIKPDYEKKFLSGSIDIKFKALSAGTIMQIDLQEPMQIKDISWNNEPLKYRRNNDVFLIEFPSQPPSPSVQTLHINYDGYPLVAKQPPWDNGWIFTKDKEGRPWMTVTCEGLGASSWFPCKDYLGDEPDDGASLYITVPDTLIGIGNGRLKEKVSNGDGTTTYHWEVVNPINNYNIIPYIGKYDTWHSTYEGEKGKLDCDYWVIDYNVDKSRIEFKEVDSMLKCFEYWFGPFPFYEDGYKLVEAPHLGMEHQSAIAYGNNFKKGYAGRDVSESGWGLKWDFIIIHESGHEWFGNNITCKDIADEWIHEGFTCYSETLYTGYYFGKEAGNDYNIGQRKQIENNHPIIRPYGVNKGPADNDEYYKASNMIHAIRQIINNDAIFREILRGLNKTFYHQTVTTKQVEDYISKTSKINFSKVFDQYLRTIQIPLLEYKINGHTLSYRWTNCIRGFNMPLKIHFKETRWIKPTEKWQILSLYPEGDNRFSVDRNFYIRTDEK